MTLTSDFLEACSPADLDDLHYACEIEYHERIIGSAKGSQARERLFNEAYDTLVAILSERRLRYGLIMDSLGLAPGTADQLGRVLRPPPARLLDVGCGSGVLVEAMRRRGYEAFGIDVSSRLIDLGRARLVASPSAAIPADCLRCGNFLQAEFGDQGRFDLVHSNDVLEHVHPDEAMDFLRKINHLLRPGGVIWLVTPNRWTGPGDATALHHPPGTVARGLHLKEYTLSELSGMLRAAGFTGVRTRLWAGGRFRKSTAARPSYGLIKVAAEPALAALPPAWRRRIMNIMDYSLVLASKAMRGGGAS